MLCERCGLNYKRHYLNPCPKCLVMLCANCEEHHSCDIRDTVLDDTGLDNNDDTRLISQLTILEEPDINFDDLDDEMEEEEELIGEFN